MTLLTACAHRLCDDWLGGSRDGYHLSRARHQAESVITVLREMGYLNEYGIAAAIAELGPMYPEHEAIDTTPSALAINGSNP